MIIKKNIARLIKYIKINRFIKKNRINTASYNISTKAKYGINVRIGKNVTIDDDVSIGDYTYINKNSSIEYSTIGKFCSVSEGVRINPIEHNGSLITTHPIIGDNGHYGLQRKRTIIGNDVLISLNVIILGGVTIGDGAIIGAGAVVTHDVKPYEVVGGVPAKHIKFRFDQKEIDYLENLRWWDWSINKIEKNLSFLKNETENIVE